MGRKIVFIRTTSVVNEPRVIKEANTLKSMDIDLDIKIVFWDRVGIDKNIQNIEGFEVFPIYIGKAGYGKGILNLKNRLKVTLEIFKKLKILKPDIIHACDLDGLLPAILYKKINNRNVKIVYDIFDFIYTVNSPIPNVIRSFLKRLDRKLMYEVDAIILPDQNRLHFIPENLYKKVYIVNNAPKVDLSKLKPRDFIKRKFPFLFNTKKIKIFYAGGLSRDRGILWLIEIAKKFKNFQVIVAGEGILKDKILQASNYLENLIYLGKMETHLVYSIYPLVDIVYVVYDPNYPHNKLSSPTKLFEALYFKKPVILTKGTYWDEIVEKYGCGWTIDYNLESLLNVLKNISKDDIKSKSLKTENLYEKVKWENSEKELINLYRELLK
jgi:succinoglycan biosynthesis protein ExoL